MKIVVDAMGGDNAPSAIVEGCIQAVNEYDVEIALTGDKDIISAELSKYTYDKHKIEIIPTTEVISNNEHPAMAIRKKKDSSMVKAINLVKDGYGDAVISAGNTGALLTGATLIIGRIKGIHRPALAPIMPGKNGAFMVIDVGANVDCKPENLVQFGVMGTVYFKRVMNIQNPKVALLNNGVEEEKGNDLTKAAHKLLKNAGLNFVGNIEPRDVLSGDIEVVVCDGFAGNTLLKTFEGSAALIFDILKGELMSSAKAKIAGLVLKPVFKNIKKKFDYTEYGGAAFLGVNGAVVKAHGSSNAKAIKNAVRQAKIFIENDVVNQIRDSIQLISENTDTDNM